MQSYVSTPPRQPSLTPCLHARPNKQAKECWACYSANRKQRAENEHWLRFWRNVRPSSGCWLWQGATTGAGYGVFRVGNRLVLAHRLAYEYRAEPIPAGLTLDHLCRTPACVRRSHLEAVSNRVNILRGNGATARHARQTHCVHGHAFDEGNTSYNKNGSRYCKACARIKQRDRRKRLGRERGCVGVDD